MTWVKENNTTETPAQRFVLMILADCLNEKTGVCNPSLDTISDYTGLSKRTVQRALIWLEENEYIEVQRRHRNVNNYRLTMSFDGHGDHQEGEGLDGHGVVLDGHCVALDGHGVALGCHGDHPTRKNQKGTRKNQAPAPSDFQDAWNQFFANEPNVIQIRDMTPARKTWLKTRVSEDPEKRSDIEFWNRVFAYCQQSEFLMGRVVTSDRKPFKFEVDFLLKPASFTKIREGKYHG